MSPRREPAKAIKKTTLRITVEGDGPTLARAHRTLKDFELTEDGLVGSWQSSDLADVIADVVRVSKAVRDAPKDFK